LSILIDIFFASCGNLPQADLSRKYEKEEKISAKVKSMRIPEDIDQAINYVSQLENTFSVLLVSGFK
jgi:hypothetical protein